MSVYRFGAHLSQNIGEISSFGIWKHTVRREVSTMDGIRFYRFTMNPGLTQERRTFWSPDDYMLLNVVYKRLGVKSYIV